MNDSYTAIKSIIRTEKGTAMLSMNKYIFDVSPKATKHQIKYAVEKIYKVHVKNVNTLKMRGKVRRLRYKEGKTPDWKKAVVTLKPGSKIELAT